MAQPLINTSIMPGELLVLLIQQRAGDQFLALVLIMLFLFVFCAAFRLPIELSLVVMLPLLLASMAVLPRCILV